MEKMEKNIRPLGGSSSGHRQVTEWLCRTRKMEKNGIKWKKWKKIFAPSGDHHQDTAK